MMLLRTKLLNLLVIITIACYYTIGSDGNAVSGEADDDNSLKQALFLVELLKSDFGKVLRESNYYKNFTNTHSGEEDNSTCPTTLDEFNSTTAVTEATVTVSGASSSADVIMATTPLNPALPFSSWPPMPMPGYPMLGPAQRGNVPLDENYRFPYRFGRRRMMPDYYYFDAPMKSRGNFRRNNDPIGDVTNETATTQAQTTTNIPSTTSEVSTLHVQETTTSTSTLSPETTKSASTQPSIQPTSQPSIQLANLLSTQASTHLDSQPSIQPATLPSRQPSTQPIITTKRSTHRTNSYSKARVRTPVSDIKATTVIVSNRIIRKLNKVYGQNLRHLKISTEKYTTEDVVMSQVASELINEFKETKSENIPDTFMPGKKDFKLKKKNRRSTMKIFLKGSSRIPIPFPENNAFCHSYPHNPLCGAMK